MQVQILFFLFQSRHESVFKIHFVRGPNSFSSPLNPESIDYICLASTNTADRTALLLNVSAQFTHPGLIHIHVSCCCSYDWPALPFLFLPPV